MLNPLPLPLRRPGQALLVPILAFLLAAGSLSGADSQEGGDDESAAAEEQVEPEVEVLPTIDRHELVSIGSDSHLRPNETANEMVTIFGNAVMEGSVWNECVTIFGDATIDGYVGNEVVCIVGNLTLGPNAEIRGEVVSIGGSLEIDPNAVINGEVVQIANLGPLRLPSLTWVGEWFSDGLMQGRLLPHQHAWAWQVAGVLLIVHLLFALVFRNPIDACTGALDRKPAMSLLNGVLFLLLYPALLFILAVSVIGVFLIPFLAAGKFLAGFIGIIAVYRYCGSQLGLRNQPILALVAGNLIFILLYAVPIIGLAVWIIAGLVGTGCVLTAIFDSMRSEADQPRRPAVTPSPAYAAVAAPGAAAAPPDAAAQGMTGTGTETPGPAPDATTGIALEEKVTAPSPELPPGVPAADVYPRVGFWPRFGATALDFFLVAGLCAFFGIQSAFLPVWLIYHIVLWSWRATTLGGIILNLRIDRIDGRKVGIDVAVIRTLGSIFSTMALFMGFFWASWDSDRQSWHDKIAGTTIIRLPRGHSLI